MNILKLNTSSGFISYYFIMIFLETLIKVKPSEIREQKGAFEHDNSNTVCKQSENEDHCYFLERCTLQGGWNIQDLVSICKNHVIRMSTADECFQIPLVSGVAIETFEEYKFIQQLIESSQVPLLQAFTSGYWSCSAKNKHPSIKDFCGIWQGWDSTIPEEILDFQTCSKLFKAYDCPSNNQTIHYVLQKTAGGVYWNFIPHAINETNKAIKINQDSKNETESIYVACEYKIAKIENCTTTTPQAVTSTDNDGVASPETSEVTKVTEYTGPSKEDTSDGINGGHQITEKACVLCQKTDDYEIEWKACSGEVLNQSCPCKAEGYASWKCGKNGLFVGNTPDYNYCHNKWIADLEKMVKQDYAAEEIGERFLYDSLNKSFFGHEIAELADLLSNLTQLFQNQTAKYNSTYKVEIYENFIPKLANITNSIIRTEKPWKQVNKVLRSFAGSKLQDFLYKIGFTLIDIAFEKDNQSLEYLEYSYSNLRMGMQLTSVEESNNLLVINYPKDLLDKVGSITVYGETNSEEKKSPKQIASVGTIIEPQTGKRLYPETMISWRETEMLLNSAVISFEFQGVQKKFSNEETIIKPLKIKSVLVKLFHSIPARGPSEQSIRRDLYAGESPTAVIGHAKCVFWNNSTRIARWDESGCEVVSTNVAFTICNCSHLSSFGVFMSIHKYENKGLAMEILSWVCSGLSIIGLILTLAVFQLFKTQLQGERETICRNICSCLLATHILSLAVLDKSYFNLSDQGSMKKGKDNNLLPVVESRRIVPINNEYCKFNGFFVILGYSHRFQKTICSCVGAILHYTLSAGFLWMAAEGHHLYRLVLRVMDGTGRDLRKTYCIISYGLPILVVGITAMIGYIQGERAYGNPELCWLSLTNYQWSFISQALLITLVNIIILILALRVAVDTKSTSKKIGIWLRGWFTLSSLLGVTWFIGIAAFDLNAYFEYVFVALNGLQGVMIFVSRILQNEQVRNAVMKRLKKRAMLKNFYTNTVTEHSSSYPIEMSKQMRNRGASDSNLWNVEEETSSSSFPRNQSFGNSSTFGDLQPDRKNSEGKFKSHSRKNIKGRFLNC